MTSDPNSTRRIAKQFAEENRTDHFDGFDGYMTRKLFRFRWMTGGQWKLSREINIERRRIIS